MHNLGQQGKEGAVDIDAAQRVTKDRMVVLGIAQTRQSVSRLPGTRGSLRSSEVIENPEEAFAICWACTGRAASIQRLHRRSKKRRFLFMVGKFGSPKGTFQVTR